MGENRKKEKRSGYKRGGTRRESILFIILGNVIAKICQYQFAFVQTPGQTRGDPSAPSFQPMARSRSPRRFTRPARSGIVGPLLKSQSSLSGLNRFISLKCLSLQSCLKLFKLLKTLEAVGVCHGAVHNTLPYKPESTFGFTGPSNETTSLGLP